MKQWQTNATVWVNDPEKGRVLVGPFGFAWWTPRKVYLGVFGSREEQPLSAFRMFEKWEEVKSYWSGQTPNSAVHRFVKTGLVPG